ncbi:TPA: hypothetical protein DEP58_04075 [Patescibacteria group bacterium]|nr:MAG: hypothetical protein UU98_C0037G0001 [Parcubacteria group bacterium GW2011_GWD2_42_14]HCC05452.1 hypothetical protein [Patescibacteria group bacterium]
MATPKFLTKDLAALAVVTVLKSIMDDAEQFGIVKKACHICVAVPSVEHHLSHHKNISMEMLYEFSYNKDLWTAEYAKIANSKALQLWEDRNDGRTDIMPHLLFPGDTVYYGGVKRHGIVVTCSGFPPWIDQMIAGMIADMIVALAYTTWRTSEEYKNEMDFVTAC